MLFQIDQSGHVEYTSQDTVLGASNSIQISLKVTSQTKRKLQQKCRESGISRIFVYRTFAALIFLLIRDYLGVITEIVIDIEYPGKNSLIKDILLEFLQDKSKSLQITFSRIGNHPPVHYLAYNVFTGKNIPTKLVRFSEIEALVIKKPIKKDRGPRRG